MLLYTVVSRDRFNITVTVVDPDQDDGELQRKAVPSQFSENYTLLHYWNHFRCLTIEYAHATSARLKRLVLISSYGELDHG
jgi:hypothetical protein